MPKKVWCGCAVRCWATSLTTAAVRPASAVHLHEAVYPRLRKSKHSLLLLLLLMLLLLLLLLLPLPLLPLLPLLLLLPLQPPPPLPLLGLKESGPPESRTWPRKNTISSEGGGRGRRGGGH